MATSVSTLAVSPTFGRFFGSLVSNSAGFAMGLAVGPTLHPAVRYLENAAWERATTKPLDYQLAAEVAAENRALEDFMRAEGAKQGIAPEKMDQVLHALRGGPGVAIGLELWRRGIIDEDRFERVLWEEKFEEEFHAPIKALKNVLLSPADLAAMRQQGYIDAARQHDEAAKQGVTAERADLMFEAAGLPPGYGELAQMLHRGIITEGEFRQAIREANTKVKYTDELLQLSHPILSPIQAATLRLKGWITDAQANQIGALSGYDAEQMERLYLMQGRPMAPGQMWTALARQTVGPGGGPFTKDDFLRAIRQSDIRPEYGEALYAIRHLYPPLFQLTRLVQSGAIDADTARDWAVKDRYAPEVVTALHAYWSRGTAATDSGYTDRAKTQLWTTAHRSYVAFESNKTQAGAALARLGVPTAERADVLSLWDAERDLIRRQLTPAQLKKAYLKAVRNPLTGANWTRDDALAALLERGYSTADANTFLDE